MTDNIVRLPGAEVPSPETDPTVIAILEDFLAKARKGEIRSIALAGTTWEGGVATVWQRGEAQNLWCLLAATDLLHARVMEAAR